VVLRLEPVAMELPHLSRDHLLLTLVEVGVGLVLVEQQHLVALAVEEQVVKTDYPGLVALRTQAVVVVVLVAVARDLEQAAPALSSLNGLSQLEAT
jgi:hypothetical protein